jgi:nicotinamide phosphoribosyltransferase
MNNIILNVDSYKASHYLQYPPGTTRIYSYIESRGGIFSTHLFFGLQIYLKKYLSKSITKYDIEYAEDFFSDHGLTFNKIGWTHILNNHGGYLPIKVEAVAEGTVLPTGNVLIQVYNTDRECYWLAPYIETSMLRAVWYPTTIATVSRECKQVIKKYLEITSDNLENLEFKLHDFGARGTSSFESASIGGAAHLVNFKGSDTISGILAVRDYYNEHMAAFSIPAAEHSTIISWGKEKEKEAYEHIIDNYAGHGKMISIVCDSYDFWYAIDNIFGKQLKEKIVNQGGTIVIRSDSGDPVEICVNTVQRLTEIFGYMFNSKGYKLLPQYIRVIHGDSVSLSVIDPILEAMKEKQLSAENITFGMGGGLLQKIDRDTLKFAMKASAIIVDNKLIDINKRPILESFKTSKAGILSLVKRDGIFKTINRNQLKADEIDFLIPVFENGKILKEWSFKEIRERSVTGN